MKNLVWVPTRLADHRADLCEAAILHKDNVTWSRQCGNRANVNATIPHDNRVLRLCGTHSKAPNVTVLTLDDEAPVVKAGRTALCADHREDVVGHRDEFEHKLQQAVDHSTRGAVVVGGFTVKPDSFAPVEPVRGANDILDLVHDLLSVSDAGQDIHEAVHELQFEVNRILDRLPAAGPDEHIALLEDLRRLFRE